MQNYFDFSRISPGAFLAHHMAQKCDGFSDKAAFVWVQFKIHFPEFAENCIQMLEMLPPTFAVHIEVINEYLQEFATQVLKDLRHSSCEYTRCDALPTPQGTQM
jgi:hypothetical protein